MNVTRTIDLTQPFHITREGEILATVYPLRRGFRVDGDHKVIAFRTEHREGQHQHYYPVVIAETPDDLTVTAQGPLMVFSGGATPVYLRAIMGRCGRTSFFTANAICNSYGDVARYNDLTLDQPLVAAMARFLKLIEDSMKGTATVQ